MVAVLYARIAVDSYLRGYWRGVGAAVNALEQSETPDEFARLVTSTPPPPWQ